MMIPMLMMLMAASITADTDPYVPGGLDGDPLPEPEPDIPDPHWLERPAAIREELSAIADTLGAHVPGMTGELIEEKDGSWTVILRKPDGGLLLRSNAAKPRDAMNALVNTMTGAVAVCPQCGRTGKTRYCTGHGHHARLVRFGGA